MEVQLDCVPCTLRQVLEAVRLATADLAIQERIIFEALEILKDYKSYNTSPEMGRAIHRLVVANTGIKDPYKKLKEESIEVAHKLYPALEEYVEGQEDRLFAAVKVSAIGNLIDAAVYGILEAEKLQTRLMEELSREFATSDLEAMRRELQAAKTVLILGDNAGETVFDKILISQIKKIIGRRGQVFFAVRSAPIINDATMEDAIASGLDQVAELVESGCTAPGMVYSEISPPFKESFHKADLVISKGQGNYETLGDANVRSIYFLLKAKCALIARHLGVNLGDYVLRKI